MNPNQIDLNRLQIFRAIVAAGNLTKAATQLRQPKSRISRQLAALEKELGTQLLFRTTRQLQLTPAGQALIHGALPHLTGLENTIERVTLGSEEVCGRIRISVPDDVGTQMMGGICHSFLAKHPKAFLDVHVSNQNVDLVRDSFDLALRIGKMRDSSLIRKKIGNLQLIPYVSPELRERAGSLLSPADLSKIPFLSFALEQGALSLRLYKGEDSRLVRLNPVFASNSLFVLRDLAIKGLGWAPLTSFLAEEAVEKGLLVPALRDWSLEGSPVQLVLPGQKEIPTRIRKFMEHIQKQLAPFVHAAR